jgi:hypothetical protein
LRWGERETRTAEQRTGRVLLLVALLEARVGPAAAAPSGVAASSASEVSSAAAASVLVVVVVVLVATRRTAEVAPTATAAAPLVVVLPVARRIPAVAEAAAAHVALVVLRRAAHVAVVLVLRVVVLVLVLVPHVAVLVLRGGASGGPAREVVLRRAHERAGGVARRVLRVLHGVVVRVLLHGVWVLTPALVLLPAPVVTRRRRLLLRRTHRTACQCFNSDGKVPSRVGGWASWLDSERC